MTNSRSHLALPDGIFFLLLAAVLLAAGPCSKELAGPVAQGEWGGDRVGLTVSATGGTLQYGCASGTIDQRIVAGTDGRFAVMGTHTKGHGGPVFQNEIPDRHPATYAGWTDGETLTLTITLTDTGERLGSYSVSRGQPARITRCL